MFQACDITKAYHRRTVLDRVSFALPAGHCLGITGENGSGKSTLLRILAQTLQADSGDVRYHGRSVLGDRNFLRSILGYVPQGIDLIPHLTAAQQLRLWQSACRCKTPICPSAAEMLQLGELLPIPIAEMSGGMQRRLSIAMALSTNPEILILDEATNGLDSTLRHDLLLWLEDWMHRGGRIVWCSHLPEETARLCGHIITLGKTPSVP